MIARRHQTATTAYRMMNELYSMYDTPASSSVRSSSSPTGYVWQTKQQETHITYIQIDEFFFISWFNNQEKEEGKKTTDANMK